MGDDSEWLKLPTEEKCQHKAWKARVTGYEELIKLFQTITDEKSPEFSKYLGLVKKFVTDSNVVAQEKGLEATLVFVENSFHAGKTAGEVCSAIVAKCLNQKPKIKDLGVAIMMAYIEAEKQEVVQEELMKGLTNKQPKVVAACVVALRDALRDFGTKIIQIKPLLKQLQTLLEDRDKIVRDESKQLAVEIYRWIGAALKPQLTNLKPVQINELDAEFEKVPPSKPQQSRFLRSQQDLKAKMMERAAAGTVDGGGDATDSGAIVTEEVDAYELMDPVDVLSKLPKDFYEKVEEKKWQDRKEALESIQKLVDTPKLENGEYGDLVRALRKVISKDTNVMLVAIAAKCIALIALGLRKKFSSQAVGCIETAIEKFKEKKANVVAALREAVDACFQSTNLEAISEVCIAALDHKTPSVKAETTAFLARCFSRCTVSTLPKKLLKPFVAALLKTANDTTLEVREASFEALGMAMKVVSEKAIMPFLMDVDPLKMAKIKEYCEKASTSGKAGAATNEAAKQPAAAAAAGKPGPPSSAKGPAKKPSEVNVAASASSSSTSSSASVAKKKSATVGAGGKGKKAAAAAGTVKEEVIEKDLSDEAVEEKMTSLFPGDTLPNLASNNWKDRLASMERMAEVLKTLSKDDIPVQAFVRTVVKKPGLKDNNFQVLKLKVDLISTLAQRGNFSKRSADYCLNELIDKIADTKNGSGVQECLSNVAEATSLDFVAPQVLASAFEQKNPKNQSEALNWLCTAIKQFGLKLKVKSLIETINKALASANPAVRTSGISLLGIIYTYMGPPLRMFFEKEKPALLQQIDAEFERVKDEKPAAPTRGLKSVDGGGGGDDDDDGRGGGGGGDDDEATGGDDNDAGININDLIPRVDISEKMTDTLLGELGDKNWKIRKEALEKIQAIVGDAKFITPNIGALPEGLKPRLVDSNKILGSMTIALCQQLAISMGPPIKQHARSIIPGLFANFGDSKPNIRQAAVKAVNTYMEQVGSTGLASILEGEVLLDGLKNENPTLRAELFGWLAEKLPTNKKLPPELKDCLLILYACLEDRNADVRKKANEALMPFMIHCGYDAMLQKVSGVKPVSKDTVMKALEQARSILPAKSTPAAQQPAATKAAAATKTTTAAAAKQAAAAEATDDTDTASCGSAGTSGGKGGKTGGKTGAQKKGTSQAASASAAAASSSTTTAAASSKKKVEEEDTSPPMKVSNAKDQRTKDEKNLKVLKWNFDTPRREFIDQLKSQMEPHFNKTLFEQLFHADFKFHIKAMDMLIKVTETGVESTISNLDLILKWMTLRFFDTNTTVLLKALEYLLIVFEKLVAENYHMTEIEAVSFLPYLINKVGDPKDNIRRDIRSILQLVCNVYPAARVSGFLMEGLKSKNAKQRTECLEEIGLLIQRFGMSMCQPSPSVGLKLIAQQIGDRDNSVRSAALNTIVSAYDIQGESIFKYVGQLSEKDMSMLEERIKRSTRNKMSTTMAVGNVNANSGSAVGNMAPNPLLLPKQQQQQPGTGVGEDGRPSSKISKIPSGGSLKNPSDIPHRQGPPTTIAKGQFQLNFDDGSDQEEVYTMPKLIEPDLDEIFNEPIKLPQTRLRLQQLSSIKPPSSLSSSSASETKPFIQSIITQAGSSDINASIQALQQIDQILKDNKKPQQNENSNNVTNDSSSSNAEKQLRGYVNQLLLACSLQLRNLHTKHVGQPNRQQDTIRLYKTLLSTLLSLYKAKELTTEVNRDVLKDLVHHLITTMLDNRLKEIKEGGSDIQNAVNVTIVRVVENLDYTCVMRAMIKLLHESVAMESSCSPQYLEIVMKCLWKMLRIMPTPIDNQVDLDRIIADIHDFLKAFPGSTWKNRPSDMPLRTLKTILHTVIKHMGEEILHHLTLVDGGGGTSEIELYIRKVLKKGNVDTNAGAGVEVVSNGSQETGHKSHKISRSVQDSLAEIFKKIGCSDTTNEGLSDLYDFKLRHPDADLDPFLNKSSEFFQNYINQGLIEIEKQRSRQQQQRPSNKISSTTTTQQQQQQQSSIISNNKTNMTTTYRQQQPSSAISTTTANTNLDPSLNKTPEEYLERLRELRARCGFDNSDFSFHSMSSKYCNNNSNNNNDNNSNNNNNNNSNNNNNNLTSADSLSLKSEPCFSTGRREFADGVPDKRKLSTGTGNDEVDSNFTNVKSERQQQEDSNKSAANLEELRRRLEKIKRSGLD